MFTNLHERNVETEKLPEDLAQGGLRAKSIPEDIAHVMYSAVGFMEGKAFIDFYNEQSSIPYPWEVAQSASSIRIPTSAIARAELTEGLVKHFIDSGAQTREALLQYMNRNSPEERALFTTLIKKALRETVSDLALIKDIQGRLMVTPVQSQVQPDGTTIVDPLGVSTQFTQNQHPILNDEEDMLLPVYENANSQEDIHEEEHRNDY